MIASTVQAGQVTLAGLTANAGADTSLRCVFFQPLFCPPSFQPHTSCLLIYILLLQFIPYLLSFTSDLLPLEFFSYLLSDNIS